MMMNNNYKLRVTAWCVKHTMQLYYIAPEIRPFANNLDRYFASCYASAANNSRRAFSSSSRKQRWWTPLSFYKNKMKALFSFKNLLKAFIIFCVGFLGRWSTNESLGVNVFTNYLDPISIGFYLTFSVFIVSINE